MSEGGLFKQKKVNYMTTEQQIEQEAMNQAKRIAPTMTANNMLYNLSAIFKRGAEYALELAGETKDGVRVSDVTLTENHLQMGISKQNGFSRNQIAALGDTMDKKGWRRRLIGKIVTADQFNKFLALKNAHIKK